MYYILLKNGKKIHGKNWKNLVINLERSTYFSQTIEEYMQGTAERVKTLTGDEIQYKDARTFLEELERVGIISIVKRVKRVKRVKSKIRRIK
jgi:hypothetical protein